MPLGLSYNPYGPYVYNRNARPLDLNLPFARLQYSFGGGNGQGGSTTYTQPGMSPFEMAKNAVDAAKTGKNIYDIGSGLFAGSTLGPSSLAALTPTVGPGGLLAGGGATSLGTEAAGALSMPAGFAPAGLGVIGPSEAAAAASTATGPGGLLVGGGGTSLAGSGAAEGGAAASGAGGLGALGYGAAGLGAMLGLIALGGGFDPDTARVGIQGDVHINPDGTLSAPNFSDYSNYGMTAPQDYFNNAQTIYGALQDKIASGEIDPSWLQPGAGLTIGYGSDADIGIENPQASLIFHSGHTTPVQMGSEQTMTGGDPLDFGYFTRTPGGYSANSLSDLIDMINTRDLPLFSAAPSAENLLFTPDFLGGLTIPLGHIDPNNAAMLQQLNPGLTDWQALKLAEQAFADSNRS